MGSDRSWRWLTLGPVLAIMALLTIVPIIQLALMSLYDVKWSDGVSHWQWVGAANFAGLAADRLFRDGIANTVVFAAAGVAVQMAAGFALALLVSKIARGRTFYRAVFLLPILVPGIVIGAIWKLMYNVDFGIIDQLVTAIGLAPRDWLGDQSLALASVIAVDVWHWTPFCFLLLLASLEALPRDVYEAAKVDGASFWQEIVHVTLPMMLPAIAVTLVFRLIVAFKVFDEVYLLTGGGPGTATEVVSFSIYRRFFTEDRVGYGSALSIVTLFVMALITILVLAALQRRGAAGGERPA